MAEWKCSACGKRSCHQYSDTRPTRCIETTESFKLPEWSWVSDQESDGVPVFPAQEKSDPFAVKVHHILSGIENMLIEKNRKYGNAALEPVRIFSKVDSLEQIRVRIDDKINRIRNRQNDEDEDVINDLIGYLVLYKIKVGEEV